MTSPIPSPMSSEDFLTIIHRIDVRVAQLSEWRRSEEARREEMERRLMRIEETSVSHKDIAKLSATVERLQKIIQIGVGIAFAAGGIGGAFAERIIALM